MGARLIAVAALLGGIGLRAADKDDAPPKFPPYVLEEACRKGDVAHPASRFLDARFLCNRRTGQDGQQRQNQ